MNKIAEKLDRFAFRILQRFWPWLAVILNTTVLLIGAASGLFGILLLVVPMSLAALFAMFMLMLARFYPGFWICMILILFELVASIILFTVTCAEWVSIVGAIGAFVVTLIGSVLCIFLARKVQNSYFANWEERGQLKIKICKAIMLVLYCTQVVLIIVAAVSKFFEISFLNDCEYVLNAVVLALVIRALILDFDSINNAISTRKMMESGERYASSDNIYFDDGR